MRIGIDARFYGSLGKGLGRYTEKLIEHLESLDQEHDYVVFCSTVSILIWYTFRISMSRFYTVRNSW
jgi:hypothetical protein